MSQSAQMYFRRKNSVKRKKYSREVDDEQIHEIKLEGEGDFKRTP